MTFLTPRGARAQFSPGPWHPAGRGNFAEGAAASVGIFPPPGCGRSNSLLKNSIQAVIARSPPQAGDAAI